ncbi:MAG: hypothetical protein GX677_01050, partial [Treponema sp.]|nr:hypothetical protein [Treponema sp.]
MALTKFTDDVEIIQALSNTPNATEGLTADQLKAKFDEATGKIKTYINDTLTAEVDTKIDAVEDVIEAVDTRIDTVEKTLSEESSGWVKAEETWTYASSNTITVPAGGLLKYAKGDKLKLTQGTVKYFYIIKVADTLLTITGGSNYPLTSDTI